MLTKEKKAEIATQYRVHETDTGSPEVQVAALTERILEMTEHLKVNRHDYQTQRSLMKLVGRRRRLLGFLNKEDVRRYRTLIASLGLRR